LLYWITAKLDAFHPSDVHTAWIRKSCDSQSNTNHPVSPEQRQTILVVDDEVIIRTAISEYLRDCGYKVIEAASVDEAVLVLQQAEITVHIVLSDVEMPGARDRL
jgi:response regulator RpfG family c-di-GMP phosphodiesterase